MKRARLFSVFLTLALFVASPKEGSANEIFSDAVAAARNAPHPFSSSLVSTYLKLSRELFKNLQACDRGLRLNKDLVKAKTLESIFSGWLTELYTTTEGDQFRLFDIVQGRNDSERLSVGLAAKAFLQLLSANEQFSEICLKVSTPTIGSARFDHVSDNFKSALTSSTRRGLLSWMMKATDGITSGDIGGTLKWLSESIFDKESFLQEAWFPDFVNSILKDRQVKNAISTFLATSHSDFQKIQGASYQIVRPFEIAYAGLLAKNQIYPFIPWLAHSKFNDPKVLACMKTAGPNLQNLLEIRDPFEAYQALSSELKLSCPDLAPLERLSLHTIEDRMSDWLLPLSVLIAAGPSLATPFNKPEAERRKDPYRTEEEESAVFERFKGIEVFTDYQKQISLRVGYDHVSAPIYLKCESEAQHLKPIESRDFILLFGVAYQTLNTEAKSRLFGAELSEILPHALDAIHSWERALDLPCEH